MHTRRRQVRLIVTTAVGAVGAVLFYFLDPEKGSVRRAAARVWFSSMVDRTLDRVLAGPQPRAEIEQEPFPDLTPRVEQPEVQPEPAHDEPLVPAGVATVEAPAHISWPEGAPADTAVTFVHGEPGPRPQIISFDEAVAEEERLPDEPVVAHAPRPVGGVRRWMLPATASLAAVAALAAVGLGLWALSLSDSRDNERVAAGATSASQARAIALLTQPGAKRIPVKGSRGQIVLVVGSGGKAVLVLSGVARAPAGKTYQAWVVMGKTPQPAGLFNGGAQSVVQLTQNVPKGAIVAVTLEPKGGLAAPSGTILFSAKRA